MQNRLIPHNTNIARIAKQSLKRHSGENLIHKIYVHWFYTCWIMSCAHKMFLFTYTGEQNIELSCATKCLLKDWWFQKNWLGEIFCQLVRVSSNFSLPWGTSCSKGNLSSAWFTKLTSVIHLHTFIEIDFCISSPFTIYPYLNNGWYEDNNFDEGDNDDDLRFRNCKQILIKICHWGGSWN